MAIAIFISIGGIWMIFMSGAIAATSKLPFWRSGGLARLIVGVGILFIALQSRSH